MKAWRRCPALLVAFAAWSITLPAVAGMSTSARFTGLSFDAVDLNPADGIDASVAVQSVETSLIAYLFAPRSMVDTSNPPQGTAGAARIDLPTASIMASTSGAAGDLAVDITASQAGGQLSARADASQTIVLTLSPFSQVFASWELSLISQWQGEQVVPYRGFADIGGRLGPTLGASASVSRRYTLLGDTAPSGASQHTRYALNWRNDTAHSIDLTFWLGASGSSLLVVTAIPEPATTTMLLAGLAITAAGIRRQRRCPAPE